MKDSIQYNESNDKNAYKSLKEKARNSIKPKWGNIKPQINDSKGLILTSDLSLHHSIQENRNSKINASEFLNINDKNQSINKPSGDVNFINTNSNILKENQIIRGNKCLFSWRFSSELRYE